MSMSRGCLVVKWTDNKWYIIVAQEEYDFDFDDYCIYGPSSSEEQAFENMPEANPGSYNVVECKAQKDIGSTFAKSMRKYIKNGYRNPSMKSKRITKHYHNW
jgi:hypothetical protein